MTPVKTTITFLIVQPNRDELEYETEEQALDAIQYYPQGTVYSKTTILEYLPIVTAETAESR
jgi:hypothetical protein